jgi:hypothetical protein
MLKLLMHRVTRRLIKHRRDRRIDRNRPFKKLHNCSPHSWQCPDKVKVKQFHYRPWQALRVPGSWGSQMLIQSAHKGSKVVSVTHRPPLPQEIFLVLIYVRGWVDPRAIVRRAEGLCQWKIPVTPLGIDPATFRFVVQCLNHCATACG